MKFGRGERRSSPSRWRCPSARQDVTLVPVAAARAIPARVLECGPDSMLVAIMVPDPAAQREQLEGWCSSSWARTGACAVAARVEHRGSIRPGRRCASRPRARSRSSRSANTFASGPHAPCSCTADRTRGPVQSYTVDLSGGGFLLAGPDSLKIGDEVEFQLTLTPGVLLISGTGRVVRIDDRAAARSSSRRSASSTAAA